MRETPRTLMPEFAPEELAVLLDLLRSHSLTGNHLEIGTAAGGTLAKMMSCYNDQARPHFVVIDTMTYFAEKSERKWSGSKSCGVPYCKEL